LVVTREVAQARIQMSDQLALGRDASIGAGVEDQQSADVHVRRWVVLLELEKGRVERAQMFGHAAR
jgi:hypothetical protein